MNKEYETTLMQGSIILIKGRVRKDGKHFLFAAPIKHNAIRDRLTNKDKSASRANVVTMTGDLYWITEQNGQLTGKLIDYKDNVTRAEWLGLRTPGDSIVLNAKNGKTPLHYSTRRYTTLVVLLQDLHEQIRLLPNIKFNI